MMPTNQITLPSPCFVLCQSDLERNLRIFDRIQQETGAKAILAFKGFSMWSSFEMIKRYIHGATASSLNEVRLCIEEFGAKAHTYAVAYSTSDFEAYCQRSSHLTFNSLNQLDKFKDLLSKFPNVSFGLRVNPLYSDVDTELYNPSSPTSRLGIHPSLMPEFLPKEVEGLHFHTLCESSVEGTKGLIDAIEDNFGQWLKDLKWVNLGGGHLITRQGYDLDSFINRIKDFKSKYDLEIIVEPGSAFAWDTGYLYTTVLDIVENGGVRTAIVDASFTCHMPDCLEMPYKPKVTLGDKPYVTSGNEYRIGGVSCLAGDFMEGFFFDCTLEIGDHLIFHDMMHYTMVKTNFFNGVQHPSIGSMDDAGNFTLIREFTYQDYKSRLS